jgi:glycerophosphoryl diester phosphodiesterase
MERTLSEADQLKIIIRENVKMGRVRQASIEIRKENWKEFGDFFQNFSLDDEESLENVTGLILQLKEKVKKINEFRSFLEEKKVQAVKVLKKVEKNQSEKSTFLVKKVKVKDLKVCEMTLNEVQVKLLEQVEFFLNDDPIFKVALEENDGSSGLSLDFDLKDYLHQKIEDLLKDYFDVKITLKSFDHVVKILIQINLKYIERVFYLKFRITEIDKQLFETHQKIKVFHELLDSFSLKLDKSTQKILSSFKDVGLKRNSCCEDCLLF